MFVPIIISLAKGIPVTPKQQAARQASERLLAALAKKATLHWWNS